MDVDEKQKYDIYQNTTRRKMAVLRRVIAIKNTQNPKNNFSGFCVAYLCCHTLTDTEGLIHRYFYLIFIIAYIILESNQIFHFSFSQFQAPAKSNMQILSFVIR